MAPEIAPGAARLRVPLRLGREGRRAGEGAVRLTRQRSYFSYGQVVFRAAGHALSGRWHVDARNAFLFADTGLPGLIELSRLSGIPLQRMARSSPGTAIPAMQVARALQKGILVPYRKREPEGFLDGSESPDLARYEAMLREAEEEVLGPLRQRPAPPALPDVVRPRIPG